MGRGVTILAQETASIDRAISYYITDKKINHDQLAEYLGISSSALYNKRNGKNEWLLSELVKLSELMGKTIDELTGFEAIFV